MAERTRSFTEAIEAAKVEAAEVVAAAEREAESVRAARRAAAEEAERLAAAEEAERLEAAAAATAASIDDDLIWQWDDEPAAVEEVEVVPATAVLPPLDRDPAPRVASPFARQSAPLPPPQQINVSIDADAFARVFATVFAAIVEQRVQQLPPVPYLPYAVAPAAPAVPAKQGFWRHARHPDVLLLGIATAIVLVVLAAWLA